MFSIGCLEDTLGINDVFLFICYLGGMLNGIFNVEFTLIYSTRKIMVVLRFFLEFFLSVKGFPQRPTFTFKKNKCLVGSLGKRGDVYFFVSKYKIGYSDI